MEVIVSHMNLDFDGLASMVAAKKLHPNAQLVVTDKLNQSVKQFLAIYRDKLELIQDHLVPWEEVTHVIIVDVASAKRVGPFMNMLEQAKLTIYDHHPPQLGDLVSSVGRIEQVGAAVTLLIEEIQKRKLSINMLEATLFGLGIYTDTGYFSYSNTTSRDLIAASYLLEQGMNLELIRRFSDDMDYEAQFGMFNQLLHTSQEFSFNGVNILICSHQQDKFQGGLSTITRKLMETTGVDAVISIVDMQKNIYIVCRASSKRINFLPLLKTLGGGGHEQAGSATIKKGDLQQVFNEICTQLELIIKPAITARTIMVSPVKTIPPHTTIEDAAQLMFRYGHSGFPVVEEDELVGIISRRDIDKATRHGLGHAPVKAYMSTKCITIHLDTSLEEIQQIMIKHDVGRLPVIEDGKILGIISRTNIIEVLHNQERLNELVQSLKITDQNNLALKMKEQLPDEIYHLLIQVGHAADQQELKAYLIGGIVRDIILNRDNDDIDIVIEGDGIRFAYSLAELYGGEVKEHSAFGTSTWKHPSGLKIDITSSRFEYYDHPAALPIVEHSNLREDLSRRDFTINAMATQLNQAHFGQIIDFFNGREHIASKTIKILHNLSFIEDPTRILRAVRFETRFNFTMDQQTLQLAAISMDKLRDVSKARIMAELYKLFSEAQPLVALKRMMEINLWQTLLKEELDQDRIRQHGKMLVQVLEDKEWNINFQLVPFLYIALPSFKHGKIHALMHQLAQSKSELKFLEELTNIRALCQDRQAYTQDSLHINFSKITDEALLFYFTHPEHEQEYPSIAHYLIQRREMPFLLNGEDLIKAGIEKGPLYARILFEAELAYFKEEISNREEALLWLQSWTK